jgi:hypothetical protein
MTIPRENPLTTILSRALKMIPESHKIMEILKIIKIEWWQQRCGRQCFSLFADLLGKETLAVTEAVKYSMLFQSFLFFFFNF